MWLDLWSVNWIHKVQNNSITLSIFTCTNIVTIGILLVSNDIGIPKYYFWKIRYFKKKISSSVSPAHWHFFTLLSLSESESCLLLHWHKYNLLGFRSDKVIGSQINEGDFYFINLGFFSSISTSIWSRRAIYSCLPKTLFQQLTEFDVRLLLFRHWFVVAYSCLIHSLQIIAQNS